MYHQPPPVEHSSFDWDSVLPYWGRFIYDRFDIVMKIEYWIGLADILLRIPDIHVGPLNTMSDIVLKNEYWIGWIIFGTLF